MICTCRRCCFVERALINGYRNLLVNLLEEEGLMDGRERLRLGAQAWGDTWLFTSQTFCKPFPNWTQSMEDRQVQIAETILRALTTVFDVQPSGCQLSNPLGFTPHSPFFGCSYDLQSGLNTRRNEQTQLSVIQPTFWEQELMGGTQSTAQVEAKYLPLPTTEEMLEPHELPECCALPLSQDEDGLVCRLPSAEEIEEVTYAEFVDSADTFAQHFKKPNTEPLILRTTPIRRERPWRTKSMKASDLGTSPAYPHKSVKQGGERRQDYTVQNDSISKQ